MATASQNNLSLVVNRQDINGINIENRLIGAIAFSGVAGEFDVRQAPGTGQQTLDLPTTIVLQFYFRNTDTTGVITLVGTPQGGAQATLAVLPPGAAFVYWSPVTSASAGYTSLKYTADTTGTKFEMFLGG